jgi:PKD repeat protein
MPGWKHLVAVIGTVFTLLGMATSATAATVSIAWNPVTTGTISGYSIYYGPVSAGALTQPVSAPAVKVDIGNQTSYTLTGLSDSTAYQFAVTARYTSGGESTFSNQVTTTTSGAVPVAQFSASATTGAAPLAMNFVNASTGSIQTYTWTFGDGTTSTLASPSKIYTNPGTYTVSLKVVGPSGTDTETKTGYITVTAPAATALLTKDFANGSITGWSIYDHRATYDPAPWRVLAGELVQEGDNYVSTDLRQAGSYLLYDAGLNWTDYRAKFVMRGTGDAMGLMFRYADAYNYYRFSWDQLHGYRRLVKNVGGTFTSLASDAVPYVPGRNYQVEIVAQGTNLEVWIDGTRIFKVTDSSRNRGSVAFYTRASSGVYFDNLTVQ